MNTNSNIGKKVKVVRGFTHYINQTGTVVNDSKEGSIDIKMSDGKILDVWINGNGKYCGGKPEGELVTDEKPSTFYITSDYPEVMKVFWEEMKKVGYYSNSDSVDRTWLKISPNSLPSTIKTGKDYMDMYISSKNHKGDYGDKQFQIPQQWAEALQYITDAAKYWEEVEKEPEYKVGDWVYLKSHKPNSTYGRYNPVGSIAKIKRIDENLSDGKGVHVIHVDEEWGNWYYEDIRSATTEEIEAAQVQVVCIGDSKLQVKILANKIVADGKEIDAVEVRGIVDSMKATRKICSWSVTYNTCKIGCCENVKLSELQQIVEIYNRLSN